MISLVSLAMTRKTFSIKDQKMNILLPMIYMDQVMEGIFIKPSNLTKNMMCTRDKYIRSLVCSRMSVVSTIPCFSLVC